MAGEHTSHPHTRLIKQTKSGASHFSECQSLVSGLWRQSRRNPTRPFVSISALQTDIQREAGLVYYSIGCSIVQLLPCLVSGQNSLWPVGVSTKSETLVCLMRVAMHCADVLLLWNHINCNDALCGFEYWLLL